MALCSLTALSLGASEGLDGGFPLMKRWPPVSEAEQKIAPIGKV